LVSVFILAALGLGVALATAYLTAADYLVMPTRSGFGCYQAVPSCPPLPSAPVRVFEPNWANGVGLAALVTLASFVGLRWRTIRRPRFE
jgi:hypothetical protein